MAQVLHSPRVSLKKNTDLKQSYKEERKRQGEREGKREGGRGEEEKWQESKHLVHLLLLLQVNYQAARLEIEQLRLELVPIWMPALQELA